MIAVKKEIIDKQDMNECWGYIQYVNVIEEYQQSAPS